MIIDSELLPSDFPTVPVEICFIMCRLKGY